MLADGIKGSLWEQAKEAIKKIREMVQCLWEQAKVANKKCGKWCSVCGSRPKGPIKNAGIGAVFADSIYGSLWEQAKEANKVFAGAGQRSQ